MLKHRDRRATPARIESAPLRSRRPKGDDGGSNWSENALGSTLRVDVPPDATGGLPDGVDAFPLSTDAHPAPRGSLQTEGTRHTTLPSAGSTDGTITRPPPPPP
ncbi:hypothetical protein [Sphingomonas sp. CFBP 13720]|uniref:hypothetical protein n=1 Tax=Sphingomonas sp. CFBP 13720 TaxID=2775302 RepID=UPI00177E8B03|nr:hypothetical protein [Sphingomonas sp. CFBP 13720]MBD8678339.1 hypothetical protein [Sphingomonas sp. CFBP 13720]